jgi:hypothetical protein
VNIIRFTLSFELTDSMGGKTTSSLMCTLMNSSKGDQTDTIPTMTKDTDGFPSLGSIQINSPLCAVARQPSTDISSLLSFTIPTKCPGNTLEADVDTKPLHFNEPSNDAASSMPVTTLTDSPDDTLEENVATTPPFLDLGSDGWMEHMLSREANFNNMELWIENTSMEVERYRAILETNMKGTHF